jgi:hypothetical protein
MTISEFGKMFALQGMDVSIKVSPTKCYKVKEGETIIQTTEPVKYIRLPKEIEGHSFLVFSCNSAKKLNDLGANAKPEAIVSLIQNEMEVTHSADNGYGIIMKDNAKTLATIKLF